MQYAYIKYPAATIRCLLKRHMIWERSYPGAAQAPSCSVSWTASGWNYRYVGGGDGKISESWWEVVGNQMKSVIYYYFAVRGRFLDLLPARSAFADFLGGDVGKTVSGCPP